MRLNELIKGLGCRVVGDDENVTIGDIQIDSREVAEGTLFVARVGWYDDGHSYIDAAIEAGAAAVAVSREEVVPAEPSVPFVVVQDEDSFLAEVATRFFGNPTADLTVVGVTGTNGKTTVAFLVSQLLDMLGINHALISTVHYRVGDEIIPAPNTTPDSLVVQRLARRALDRGARMLVMEVSSHGIAHARIQGTEFDCVGFTNLSREHLDFHHTFEAYRDTKRRLFTDILLQSQKETTAVVCTDSAEGRAIFGLSDADHTLGVSSVRDEVSDLTVFESEQPGAWCMRTSAAEFIGNTPLVGGFNRANLAVALGLAAAATRQDWHDLFRLTPHLRSAPGRLQRAFAPNAGEPEVFVDYAHTPDAVGAVIDAVRESSGQRTVAAVVGCGGDRDRGKRSEMAVAALKRAEHVIFTADNPRSEQVSDILDDMTEGLEANERWSIIEGRTDAIYRAVEIAEGGVVLLLGKGHEGYQEVGGVRYAFDDAEEARRAVAALRTERSVSEIPLLSGWSAARIARAVDGELQRDSGLAVWGALTTDSRKIGEGDIFVALRGDRFDGHTYVAGAVADGAALVLVEDRASVGPGQSSVIVVEDTHLALLRLSGALLQERRARAGRFGVVGITGSNGKTTVKEMTAVLVSSMTGSPVLKTRGNFNNRVGMPLSVAPLADGHSAAILEMGANHAGEIAELVDYARPEVSVLTSIGEAHTAGFGSLDGVRAAKREIFAGAGLRTAIIPHDELETRPDFWVPEGDAEVIDFGLRTGKVRAARDNARSPVALAVVDDKGEATWNARVELKLPGHHQGTNLAAALAAAVAHTGADWPDEKALNQWMASLVVPGGRWAEREAGRRLLIDDAYNANPTSMRASLQTVAEYPGTVWAVLGTMHELSDDSSQVRATHEAIGAHAATLVERVIGVGEFADEIAAAAGDKGVACPSREAAIAYIQEHAPEDAVLLFKGSRAARLEDVQSALLSSWEVA